ncbi:Iron siderophore sensor protein [Nitrincola lacisaponensis]|uniref:Iron siderophore sensor protein n=1 Tax=Nitrincola lacisaponensis TaxID=267850 RepID=A0A063Y1Z0_9GAMM|nr:FecR family protein [Nitrincola lacisaponensis]KDE38786.1 Iron siderophore sensor protein [Nitrincola lacisaponensis]
MNSDRLTLMDELPDTLLEEAAIWQARLREANLNSSSGRKLRADFNQWLLEDTRNRAAFAEMESLWLALEAPLEQVIAEELPAHNINTNSSANATHDSACQMTTRHGFLRMQSQGLALASCLVLAILVTFGWQQDWLTRWQSDYITLVGEKMPIVTEDNSHIVLNTNTALAKDYNTLERRIRLLKGEAWFEVAANDNRPFIVSTSHGSVKVTGTHFNVRLMNDVAIISLDEGRVELLTPNMQQDAAVILLPGQQAVLSGRHISTPAPFDRTAVTAWLRDQLVFYNTPLGDVVDTLNRHRQGRIVITSNELKNLKISGIFSTNTPDSVLEVITNTLPINQIRLTDYLVLLH